MRKTRGLIEKLIRLAHGDTLPASSLRGDWFEQMYSDGVLIVVTHGSKKCMRAVSEKSLRDYLESQYDIRNLEETLNLFTEDIPDRVSQVNITGDSKFIAHRTFKGFLVNSYQPIPAVLNNEAMTIFPQEGSYTFVTDYQSFSVSDDVVIVGMENSENFRFIKQQQHLFDAQAKILFVSRYPQNGDLVRWLLTIPNRYIHFGDLDLAGIAIYQNEFYRYLGERSSFFLPADFKERIAKGSRERYDTQLPRYGKMKIEDQRLSELLSCIHHYHRGYDQEGFILM